MTIWGWRTTFFAVAGAQITCLLLVMAVVREAPIGVEYRSRGTSPLAGLGSVCATPAYWLLAVAAFFWYANYMAVQGLWGGPYLMDVVGLSRQAAGMHLLVASLGFLAGCLVIGRIAELVGSHRRVMLGGQLALLAGMTIFLGPAARLNPWLLLVLFFLLGLAVSAGVAIYPLIRQRFRHDITGTALTAVNFFILLGAAAAQQVMGLVIGRYPIVAGSYPAEAYHQAFLLPMGGLAVAILIFSRLQESTGETA
jgi:predicted MFS family arabinose efflux permease